MADKKPSSADDLRIDLWTAHPLQFHQRDRGGHFTVPRFTECYKPKYTARMKDDLERWVERMAGILAPAEGDFVVLVHLEDMNRYLFRSEVLTRKEYDAVRDKERGSLRALSAKQRWALGESATSGGGDPGGGADPG